LAGTGPAAGGTTQSGSPGAARRQQRAGRCRCPQYGTAPVLGCHPLRPPGPGGGGRRPGPMGRADGARRGASRQARPSTPALVCTRGKGSPPVHPAASGWVNSVAAAALGWCVRARPAPVRFGSARQAVPSAVRVTAEGMGGEGAGGSTRHPARDVIGKEGWRQAAMGQGCRDSQHRRP
jgi:hypothetical protein